MGYATMLAALAASSGRLPASAHTAEGHLDDGMLDAVVERPQLRELLWTLLSLFANRSRVKAKKGEEESDGKDAALEGAWHEVQLARHVKRPSSRDFIGRIASRFVELR